MDEIILRIIASVVATCLLCASTLKLLGAMQQSGYKNAKFWGWITRKDNLQFNRLLVLSLCLALVSAVTSLCFSFLGKTEALLISALPFFGLMFLFLFADEKFALKVSVKRTGRVIRLFVAYFVVVLCAAFTLITALMFLDKWISSDVYGFLAYVPVAILPALLPFLLIAANVIMTIFENLRNKNYVKRAGQVLNERDIIRIGIVGSYGKTSVKNILYTILSEKYTVVATPASFNTPMGIARTVCDAEFEGKQILIAEMGARKAGDIEELCALVKPDYAIFTSICEQHVQGFGSLDNVWAEKSKILKCGAKKVVCGAGLRERLEAEFADRINDTVLIENGSEDVEFGAAATAFTLNIYGGKVRVNTPLLGNAAVENIRLAVRLCIELGMTAEEIVRGIEKIKPIPHRLYLIENKGIYILDDSYNCNPKSAEEALNALLRFGGRKCIVTPGIVECGVLEEKINGELGEKIARAKLEKVILVGDTLINVVKKGYERAGGDMDDLEIVKTLDDAQEILSVWLQRGDAVLFLNDLPDVY